jgi:hypothetical protein
LHALSACASCFSFFQVGRSGIDPLFSPPNQFTGRSLTDVRPSSSLYFSLILTLCVHVAQRHSLGILGDRVLDRRQDLVRRRHWLPLRPARLRPREGARATALPSFQGDWGEGGAVRLVDDSDRSVQSSLVYEPGSSSASSLRVYTDLVDSRRSTVIRKTLSSSTVKSRVGNLSVGCFLRFSSAASTF